MCQACVMNASLTHLSLSQKSQEQQDKVNKLFLESELASRVFLQMAEDEGLSQSYLRLGVKELSTFNILGSSLASR